VIVMRCAALGMGVLLALALGEGLLRLLHLAPTNGVATVTEAEFRSVPGILSPGQRLVDRSNPRLPYQVATDSLGYRGPDVPFAKDSGEFRVLFTGDSFTFGDFVDDDQTLPAQLERRLHARCGRVRVVNAGLGDATIVDEAHLVERGLRLSPDVVILLFSENDVSDLNRVSTWDRLAENRRAKSRFPLSLAYPLLRRTALWNLGLHVAAVARARAHPRRVDWSVAGREDSATPRLRDTYRRALLALRDTLAARQVPLVVAAYPSHLALFREAQRGQLAWFTQMARQTDGSVVNLMTPLAVSGLPATTLYLLPYDGHPSPRGYEVASAYLADELAASRPFAAVCGARPVRLGARPRVPR